MKMSLPSISLLAVLLVFLSRTCPAAQKPAPPAEPPVLPKSVFANDPTVGKDPFFPKSTRRPLVAATGLGSDTHPTIPLIPDKIVLQGLSGTKEKRLAILNNHTFEAGEEGDIKLDGLIYRVKIIEIRDRSAVISFKGLTKELQLRRGL